MHRLDANEFLAPRQCEFIFDLPNQTGFDSRRPRASANSAAHGDDVRAHLADDGHIGSSERTSQDDAEFDAM